MSATKDLLGRHRRSLWSAEDGRCHYCKRGLRVGEVTLDHIVPKAFGGPNEKWNLVASCAPCNNSYGHAVSKCDCRRCKAAVDRSLKLRKQVEKTVMRALSVAPETSSTVRTVAEVRRIIESRLAQSEQRYHQEEDLSTQQAAALKGYCNGLRQALRLLDDVPLANIPATSVGGALEKAMQKKEPSEMPWYESWAAAR